MFFKRERKDEKDKWELDAVGSPFFPLVYRHLRINFFISMTLLSSLEGEQSWK